MNNPTTEYVPGVCNINTSEVRKRRNIGYAGLTVLLVLLVPFVVFDFPVFVWLVTFIPAFLMTTGFLQAKSKFCVGYAAAEMKHTGEQAEKIADTKAVALDKQRAKKINLQALSIALLITVLYGAVGLLTN